MAAAGRGAGVETAAGLGVGASAASTVGWGTFGRASLTPGGTPNSESGESGATHPAERFTLLSVGIVVAGESGGKVIVSA